ncbi:MAG: protein kinase [Vicinamibacterales bacterium]
MLVSGVRLGPYEIVAPLGAGGMGEVYRARDTRLHRDVAIKVLPATVAGDASRVARFEQEARAIAALSHPNVLSVFDTGVAPMADDAKRLYVVTELLEGQTLGERLASGALPVRKATEIASQIARGLAAAHDKGIVHRDLKPDNVFLTAAGQVKILDFGLARTLAPIDSPAAVETRAAITDAGTVLGTVGYMAPEQVRGHAADARADLFALGIVLYEMLTGGRAFLRPTAAETMTAILNEDPPDLAAARAGLSPALDRIVGHCLEKDPGDRFQTARDVAFALDALSGSGVTAASAPDAVRRSGARLMRERIGWALVTLLLAATAIWVVAFPQSPQQGFSAPHYATVLLPEGVTLPADHPAGRRFAISPDGARIAFIGAAGSRTMLWLRSLNETHSRVIDGSEGAAAPFWSPDSRILAFRQKDQLMKLDAGSGGRAVAAGPLPGAGTWMRGPSGEDFILASRDTDQTLRLLSKEGEAATDLFVRPPDRSEIYAYPAPLPDGRHFLFAYGQPNDPSSYGLYLGRIGSNEKTQLSAGVLTVDSINSQYASGHVVSVSNLMIRARTFDPEALALGRESINIAGPVQGGARTSAAFSVSQNGVLAFQPTSMRDGSRLMVVDRSGRAVRDLGDTASYSNVELSPDGSRLAVSVIDDVARARDIWVVDMTRGIRSRATYDPSDERSAVWSPDGRSLVYTSKGLDLYTRPIGTGAETPFVKDGVSKDPRGFSADGAFFVYRVTGKATGNDIWMWRPAGGSEPRPFLVTPFDENYAVFSPDGRWIAYVSDESARPEVYVTSFPSGEGKWQISTEGGSFPRWRQDGEIVYLGAANAMMAAKVNGQGPVLVVSAAERLFQTSAVAGPGSPFDLSPDGRHFVINSTIPSNAPPSLTVLYNWPALVNRR